MSYCRCGVVTPVFLAIASLVVAFFAGARLGRTNSNASSSKPSSPVHSSYNDSSGCAIMMRPDTRDPHAHFSNMTLSEIFNTTDIPESFDTRAEWLGCGQFVVDQGQCGDCWAASGANTLGDRACIHLKPDGSAIEGSRGGAGGIGAGERMFHIQGRCVGAGSDALAHAHGCQRQKDFPSPQRLVSCATTNRDNNTAPTFHAEDGYQPGTPMYTGSNGCNGGTTDDTWAYFYHEGLTSFDGTQKAGCTPYTSNLCSGKDPHNNGCRTCAAFDQCFNTGLKPSLVTIHSFGYIMEKDLPSRPITGTPRTTEDFEALDRQVRKMQVEILTNGPLHVCIDDYANFGTFFNLHGSGVYNSTEGTPMTGGHCIELIGWGVDHESNLPFWTFKNSWGPSFASAGYGRWLRGADLCGIESDVYAGCPTGSSCKLTAGVVPVKTSDSEVRRLSATALALHRTHAERPSRVWQGGKEVELTREAFSHSHVSSLVVAAVRKALDDASLSEDSVLRKVRRVWSRSVRGLRVRVELEGQNESFHAHRHISGEINAM